MRRATGNCSIDICASKRGRVTQYEGLHHEALVRGERHGVARSGAARDRDVEPVLGLTARAACHVPSKRLIPDGIGDGAELDRGEREGGPEQHVRARRVGRRDPVGRDGRRLRRADVVHDATTLPRTRAGQDAHSHADVAVVRGFASFSEHHGGVRRAVDKARACDGQPEATSGHAIASLPLVPSAEFPKPHDTSERPKPPRKAITFILIQQLDPMLWYQRG